VSKLLPNFLVSECLSQADGTSQEFDLGNNQGKMLQLTLGITRIIEQESIDVTIWGSSDKTNWGVKPIVSFPQKFYCGVYTILADLSEHPEVRSIRVQWKLGRWGRGDPKPMFGFYVFAEEVAEQAMAMG
jgi:hypothetical protein